MLDENVEITGHGPLSSRLEEFFVNAISLVGRQEGCTTGPYLANGVVGDCKLD